MPTTSDNPGKKYQLKDAADEMDSFAKATLREELPVCTRRPLEACLPPPVSTSQSLIELLTGELESAADNITLPKDKVLEIIQHLRAPEESEATEACSRELADVKSELKSVKVHLRLGDYAGKVFNDLRDVCWGSSVRVRADVIARETKQNVADGSSEVQVSPTMQKAFDKIPQELWRLREMTVEKAQYAVCAYDARNSVCHSSAAELRDKGRWDQLAQHISKDLTELAGYLPDDQIQHQTTWRSIITYYRDSYTRFDEEKQAWEEIPEGELSLRARSKMPIGGPVDWKTLPAELRQVPFDSGDYGNLGSEASKLRARRIKNRSDPHQDGKRKRDEASVEFLEGGPSTKVSRLDDTDGTPSSDRAKEEYLRYLNTLQQLGDSFPRKFKEYIQQQTPPLKAHLANSRRKLWQSRQGWQQVSSLATQTFERRKLTTLKKKSCIGSANSTTRSR